MPLVVAVATSAGAIQPVAAPNDTTCAPAVRPVAIAPLARQAPLSTRHCAPAETASAGCKVTDKALVVGGAIGNAIDRLAFGFVTDFIATTSIDFPVFNVAAVGITVGVVLALIGYMFLSPAAREVDATAELNARDEARAKRKAQQRGERARKIRERSER